MVHDGVAVDQVCGTATHAKVFYGVDGCLFYLWVIGQSEIVIAAEADNVSVIDLHLDLLRTFCDSSCAVTLLFFSLFECLAEF